MAIEVMPGGREPSATPVVAASGAQDHPRARLRARSLGALLVAGSAWACGSDGALVADAGSQSVDAGPPPVRALYDLGAAPMRFGAVPWPDDAYVDESGRIRVRQIPTRASEDFAGALADALSDLDGFGTQPTVYFSFDGDIDVDSLPHDPADTLESNASVFLVDADTSSPEAFERIAVEVDYAADTRQVRLRPAFGRALNPGRLYAAVITRRVEGQDGRPVEGAERFVAIRDAEMALTDSLERAARARYAPVLETLASRGLARDRVAALAVFRVQTVRDDLADARELLRESGPGVAVVTAALTGSELDSVLGTPLAGTIGLDAAAPHEHIGWMVHGRFESPNLLSMRPFTHGSIRRTPAGLLRVEGTDELPFSLWLPQGLAAGARLPVVIMQHGLTGERSDALALANALTSSGYAVIAIDAPFHGLRAEAGDHTRRFTDADEPDGFGDLPGDFAGERDTMGALTELHPFYYRDAVRQGVVDLMQLVHLLEEGDFSALQAAAPALSDVELETSRIGFVGLDLGADMGVILGALEPQLGALVLAFADGSTLDGWVDSPARASLAQAVFTRLGIDADAIGLDEALRSPDVDMWRMLVDRASALAYAPALRRLAVNTLLLMARDDEVVHNAGTEALAHALGAVMIGGEPNYVAELETDELRPGATVSANFDIEGGAVTRVLYALDPAAHDALTHARGRAEYEHPVSAPFARLESPVELDNPIAEVLMQLAFFFESYRACPTTVPASICAASVVEPMLP